MAAGAPAAVVTPIRGVTYLPQGRNTDRKTDRIAFARVAGGSVRLYSIRYGKRQTGYARGGMEGPLGPVCGYGVLVECGDFVQAVAEFRQLADARTVYEQTVGAEVAP